MSTSVRITTGDWPAPPAGTLKYNERGLEDAKSFAERYGVHVSLPPESGDRTPLVLVLGWYGSSLPLLAQYFAFLRQEGYVMAAAICPPKLVMDSRKSVRRAWATHILSVLQATSLGNGRPWAAWVFSNGAAMPWALAADLLATEKGFTRLRDSFRGVVCDSAPCFPTALSCAAANLPLAESRVGKAWVWVSTFALVTLGQVSGWLGWWDGEVADPWRWFRQLEEIELGTPELYVYCDDDPICPSGPLRKLLDARRARGVAVEELRFGAGESSHVAHLKHRPKQYLAALLPFLRKAFSRKRS